MYISTAGLEDDKIAVTAWADFLHTRARTLNELVAPRKATAW